MPGEELMSAAASGWTGTEAVVFAVIGVAAILSAVGLWHHVRDCKAESRRVREELTQVKLKLAELAALLRPKT